MKLSEYFEKTKGRGVIATSDSKGKVGYGCLWKASFHQ